MEKIITCSCGKKIKITIELEEHNNNDYIWDKIKRNF